MSRNHNIGLGLPEIALSAFYSLVCVGTNHIINQFANQILILSYLTSSTAKCGSKISLRKNNPCNLRALRGKDKTPVELPILLQLLKLPTICVPSDMHSAIGTRLFLWLHYSGPWGEYAFKNDLVHDTKYSHWQQNFCIVNLSDALVGKVLVFFMQLLKPESCAQ